jgi:hypothetical protein
MSSHRDTEKNIETIIYLFIMHKQKYISEIKKKENHT